MTGFSLRALGASLLLAGVLWGAPSAAQEPGSIPQGSGGMLTTPPAFQPVTAARIDSALQLRELAEVLAAEIAASGDPTGAGQGPRTGADVTWQQIAARIAPAARIATSLRTGMAAELDGIDAPGDLAALAEALGFWESPLGRNAMALEFSARRALADPGAEAAARADFTEAAARGTPRVAQVRRLIAAADLIEPAVASSLNISFATLAGIRDSGMIGTPTDAELAADVWQQEPEIRADQAGWIEALLFMATGPLTDAEVERLIVAASQPGARRLNHIMDAAATATFTEIARELGRAAVLRQSGQPL